MNLHQKHTNTRQFLSPEDTFICVFLCTARCCWAAP